MIGTPTLKTIRVGDIVTWRQGKSASMKRPEGQRHMPLGIAGCEVLAFGEDENGEPAAKIKLPSVFAAGYDQIAEANAYLADLEG